ncbi:uncharacterized protein PAC_11545 [Phialocephala subalpina]|uniref:BTB domain-containing protein n=1 Tax=Phialocephala subalpina TaxID=576137 RepID=A0A1L7X9D1_9HELO|nr:uncharacterized protein PAC_11545 [Phialocephala subalpina]
MSARNEHQVEVNGFGCKCLKHESNSECEIAAKRDLHLSISARVIVGSAIIHVFVGKDNQVFACHEDLLALHSGYFKERFARVEADTDEKIALPEAAPQIFAEFYAWLYTGNWMATSILCTQTTGQEAYALATFLEAPALQNYYMDQNRKDYKEDKFNWLYANSVESVYKVTKKGSLHRKFTSHVVGCKDPLRVFPEGSKEWKAWKNCKGPKGFFKRCPDLEEDLTALNGKDWGDTFPWDECYRKDYMVEEIPLGLTWDHQLLAKQSLQDRKKDAKNKAKPKDVRSKIELAHLVRKKEPAA